MLCKSHHRFDFRDLIMAFLARRIGCSCQENVEILHPNGKKFNLIVITMIDSGSCVLWSCRQRTCYSLLPIYSLSFFRFDHPNGPRYETTALTAHTLAVLAVVQINKDIQGVRIHLFIKEKLIERKLIIMNSD